MPEPENIKDQDFNREKLKTASFKVTGKDVEVVEKESQDSNGEVVVNVPIQALSEDRDGDYINEKGQEAIIRQLKSGTVPLMLNHGIGSNAAMYDARDIVGQFVDGDNTNGTTIGTARMRKSKDGEDLHKDAKEIVDLLEQDMPIGFSVGFIPSEVDEKENGGMEISDLDLMEVSAVGIPSNPDAVPQAMGAAVAMAKSAGLGKNEIMDSIRKSFEDTMSTKDDSPEKDETPVQDEDSKSEEQNKDTEVKQLSDDQVEVITSTISEHMSMAMEEIEAELSNDEEEEEEETDEMDEDDEDEEEEEDTVESSNDPEDEEDGKNASDHNEDSEKSSSESADQESEKESGLSEEEKTVKEEENGRKMNTLDDQEEKETDEESSEEKSEYENDPARVEQPADYWA